MLQYLKEAGYSLLSTMKGLNVTATNFKRKQVTNMYPDVRPDLAPRFRGLPEVDMNICIVCHLCEKACPTQCITIVDVERGHVEHGAEPGAPKADKKKEA